MPAEMGDVRRTLFNVDPTCALCGKETVWFTFGPTNSHIAPNNAATVDHIFTRFDPRRFDPVIRGGPMEKKYQLACKKCNFDRGPMMNEDQKIKKNIRTRGIYNEFLA
jgi:hypothetical protein